MIADTPRAVFEALAARGRYSRFAGIRGTWEFDLDVDGKWFLRVDDGRLAVTEGAAVGPPQARIIMHKDELMRLARGEGHENVVTALIRGAVKVEGDFRFAAHIQSLLPVPEEGMEPTDGQQVGKS